MQSLEIWRGREEAGGRQERRCGGGRQRPLPGKGGRAVQRGRRAGAPPRPARVRGREGGREVASASPRLVVVERPRVRRPPRVRLAVVVARLGGRAAPFHNITQMVKSPPSEASRRPTLRPGQAGRRRDGQELAHSFVPPRVVEECLNITCWVRTSFLATHVRDYGKRILFSAPGNSAWTL